MSPRVRKRLASDVELVELLLGVRSRDAQRIVNCAALTRWSQQHAERRQTFGPIFAGRQFEMRAKTYGRLVPNDDRGGPTPRSSTPQ